MDWIFDSLLKKYDDPFASNVISVESSPQRSDWPTVSAKNLINWSSGYYYAAGPNAYFMFKFRRAPHVFSMYRLRGIYKSCAPFGWDVFGSMDNRRFKKLHSVDRALCNTSRGFNFDCNETFEMTSIKKVRYIKVVNTKGECSGENNFFGLTGVDFYGSPLTGDEITCKYNRNGLSKSFLFFILLCI